MKKKKLFRQIKELELFIEDLLQPCCNDDKLQQKVNELTAKNGDLQFAIGVKNIDLKIANSKLVHQEALIVQLQSKYNALINLSQASQETTQVHVSVDGVCVKPRAKQPAKPASKAHVNKAKGKTK